MTTQKPNKLHLLSDIAEVASTVVRKYPRAMSEVLTMVSIVFQRWADRIVFQRWADREAEYEAETEKRENRR